jgi:hypothetical protein
MHSDCQNDYNYHKKTKAAKQKLFVQRKAEKAKRTHRDNRPPLDFSTRNDGKVYTLSVKPYHENYKKLVMTPGENPEEAINSYFGQFDKKSRLIWLRLN